MLTVLSVKMTWIDLILHEQLGDKHAFFVDNLSDEYKWDLISDYFTYLCIHWCVHAYIYPTNYPLNVQHMPDWRFSVN